MAPSAAPLAPPTVGQRVVRGLGWLFIGLGAVLLLYLVWLLWFTGADTDRYQQDALAAFPGFGEVDGGSALDPDALDGDDPSIGDTGDAVGDPGRGEFVLQFERPGSDEPPVNDEPLVVVSGTDASALRLGPGHYPRSADPGEVGNVVVVGHRTTYGAPFYDIDDILPGDLVHLTDRSGDRFTYRVREQVSDVTPGARIVGAGETWVLGSDPLSLGPGRYLTLISCHPRFSSAQRIVSFLELVE